MKMLSTEYRLKNLLGLSPQPTDRWILVSRLIIPQHNWGNNKVSTHLLSFSRTQSTAYNSFIETSDSALLPHHSPSTSPTMVATFHTMNPMAELSMSTSQVTSHSRPPILRKAKSYVTQSAEESSSHSPRQSRGINPQQVKIFHDPVTLCLNVYENLQEQQTYHVNFIRTMLAQQVTNSFHIHFLNFIHMEFPYK